jgi:uncharacterized protein (UPF0548 family)
LLVIVMVWFLPSYSRLMASIPGHYHIIFIPGTIPKDSVRD